MRRLIVVLFMLLLCLVGVAAWAENMNASEGGDAMQMAIGQTPEQMKELLGNGDVTITLSVK